MITHSIVTLVEVHVLIYHDFVCCGSLTFSDFFLSLTTSAILLILVLNGSHTHFFVFKHTLARINTHGLKEKYNLC